MGRTGRGDRCWVHKDSVLHEKKDSREIQEKQNHSKVFNVSIWKDGSAIHWKGEGSEEAYFGRKIGLLPS